MIQRRSEAIIGFIIGVLVGLGAALAVAVFVTKVPVPFMNKGPTARTPSQDAAEAQKNKDWDPNASLQGKNPVRAPIVLNNDSLKPAPAATPASGRTAAASATRAPATARTDVPADGRAEVKPVPGSTDPLGDLARMRAAAATPAASPKPLSAPTVADPFTYFVQAGAFRTPEEAETQRARLSLLGAEARVTEREQSGRTVYRVRVGPFERKDDADRSKEKLDASGLETALVRVQR